MSERVRHNEQLIVQVQLALNNVVACDGVYYGPHHWDAKGKSHCTYAQNIYNGQCSVIRWDSIEHWVVNVIIYYICAHP